MKTSLLLLLFFPIVTFSQTDTISLYYNIGSSVAAEQELDKIQVAEDWGKVSIFSYTDYLGGEAFNNRLSLERSRATRSRLIEKGFDSEQLGEVVGLGITGETLDSKEGIQENRRTDLVIWKKVEVKEEEESVEEESSSANQDLNTALMESKVGSSIVLKNFTFIAGQHFLTEDSEPSLDTLTRLLMDSPTLKIKIEGHICCNTTEADGLDQTTMKYNLSEARAEYIHDLLIERGISKDRVSFEGFARLKPLFPNELTEMEKQANRRVEIKIIEK